MIRGWQPLIENAKVRELPKEIYTENHHIIPRCLSGSNNKENLIRLTAKEHFICHLLLTHMVIGIFKHKMIYALWNMCFGSKNHKRHTISARQFEQIKIQMANIPRSKEHKQKLKGKIPWNKGLVGVQIPWNKGRSHSLATRKKIAQKNKGRPVTEETRKKLSDKNKGQIPWNKGTGKRNST